MIKTNACQRLMKEVAYYQQEAKENEAKLQQMKDDNKDPYDIKMFNEVVLESFMMVKESPTRLQRALEDLCLFVDMNQFDTESEIYKSARMILADQGISREEVQETAIDELEEGETF